MCYVWLILLVYFGITDNTVAICILNATCVLFSKPYLWFVRVVYRLPAAYHSVRECSDLISPTELYFGQYLTTVDLGKRFE